MPDVMYVDERNADYREARPGWFGGRYPQPRPSVYVPPSQRPTVVYGNTPATNFYRQPYWVPPTPSFASRFGMTTGELIDTAIQIFSAIQPLPGAPTSQGDSGTDVENLVIYQTALASHAKRDEQLRTLGNLLVRILK